MRTFRIHIRFSRNRRKPVGLSPNPSCWALLPRCLIALRVSDLVERLLISLSIRSERVVPLDVKETEGEVNVIPVRIGAIGRTRDPSDRVRCSASLSRVLDLAIASSKVVICCVPELLLPAQQQSARWAAPAEPPSAATLAAQGQRRIYSVELQKEG